MHSATTDQYLSDPKIMPVTSQALYSDIVAAWRHNIAEKLAPPESAKLITKVFRKHIPIGAPFSEVEDLLRKTGFEIDTDPFHFPHRKGERHDRTAASLSLAKSVFTRVTVHVYIIPETPNDFARSGELLGAFIVH